MFGFGCYLGYGIWDLGFGIHDLGLGNGDSELGIVNWGLWIGDWGLLRIEDWGLYKERKGEKSLKGTQMASIPNCLHSNLFSHVRPRVIKDL